MYKHQLYNQSPQELQSHWRACLFNQLKYSLGGERFIASNKTDQSLAMLQGIMQPVVLIEVCRGARQKQQAPHGLKTLLQALSMLSKWQQSTSMEWAHSVNPSHWGVNYKQVVHNHVAIHFQIYRHSTVGDSYCSELHDCNCLLE